MYQLPTDSPPGEFSAELDSATVCSGEILQRGEIKFESDSHSDSDSDSVCICQIHPKYTQIQAVLLYESAPKRKVPEVIWTATEAVLCCCRSHADLVGFGLILDQLKPVQASSSQP